MILGRKTSHWVDRELHFVPIGDVILFNVYDACLNLGGFANVSFDMQNSRIAYDIGACNLILNHYAQKLGYEYDDRGIARPERNL